MRRSIYTCTHVFLDSVLVEANERLRRVGQQRLVLRHHLEIHALADRANRVVVGARRLKLGVVEALAETHETLVKGRVALAIVRLGKVGLDLIPPCHVLLREGRQQAIAIDDALSIIVVRLENGIDERLRRRRNAVATRLAKELAVRRSVLPSEDLCIRPHVRLAPIHIVNVEQCALHEVERDDRARLRTLLDAVELAERQVGLLIAQYVRVANASRRR